MPTRRRSPVFRGTNDMRRFESVERKLAEVRAEVASLFELVLEHQSRIEDLEGDCVVKPVRRRSRRGSRRKRRSSR